MREITSWKRELYKSLSTSLNNASISASKLCDIELGLFLWEMISPGESCENLWVLLTGYNFGTPIFKSMSDKQKRAVAIARFYLRFYKSKQLWKDFIEKYSEVDQICRLYDVDERTHLITRRQVSICSQRELVYEQTLTRCPQHIIEKIKWAEDGKVYFHYDKCIDSVDLPTSWSIEKSGKNHKISLDEKNSRHSLSISINDLISTAKWMDEQLNTDYWERILKRISILVPADNGDLESSDVIHLDGIFNLAGMVSSGKSTLMKVLAVWAAKRNLHITLVVDSVTAIMDLVELFGRLALKAAPLLGSTNRDIHLKKVHMVKSANRFSDLANQNTFQWLSTICPLNGLRHDSSVNRPFIPGFEPCESLYKENPSEIEGKQHYCPLYYNCPVHKASIALAEANIYVATPASLIFTWAPEQMCDRRIRMYELVYRKSNIIVFDEADRVQGMLDDYFSPSQVLADEGASSWLNKLGHVVESSFYLKGRRHLRYDNIAVWRGAHRNVQDAVNHLYTMLIGSKFIREWAAREHFSTQWLIYNLLKDFDSYEEDVKKNIEESLLEFHKDPMGKDSEHELCNVWANLSTRPGSGLGYENITKWLERLNLDTDDTVVKKVEFIVTTAVLEKNLRIMIEEWDDAEEAFGLDSDGLSFFKNYLNDFFPVIPESPMGNYFGFKYIEGQKDSPGRLEVFKFLGIGRWLLINFSNIFVQSEGIYGPHTILLSGTSWAPASSSYHIQVPISAVLKAPDSEFKAIDQSEFIFKPAYFSNVSVRVSGSEGQERYNNLKKIVDYITQEDTSLNDPGMSILDAELKRLESENKQLLILTGSYDEADAVHEYLEESFRRKHQMSEKEVCKLVRDSEDVNRSNYSVIRRGEVDSFAAKNARILIAPLLAIERGHNILNDEGVAALGSAFFFVRPMPIPGDLLNNTLFINHWAINNIINSKWINEGNLQCIGDIGDGFRRRANRQWRKRMKQSFYKKGGTKTMEPEDLSDLYWTKIVLIWQVMGRLIRGGQSARVYFMDAAFAPNTAKGMGNDTSETSMLIGMREELRKYLDDSSNKPQLDKKIAQALYGPFYKAINHIRGIE